MKQLTLITFCIAFASLLLNGLEMKQHPAMETIYQNRTKTELSDAEKQITGKWKGTNREVEWEIFRKEDGTYEIILKGMFDGQPYTDYHKGIWGIINESYYYSELETNYLDMEFSNTPSYERIVKSEADVFQTSHPGAGPNLQSIETRVSEFSFPLWKAIQADPSK